MTQEEKVQMLPNEEGRLGYSWYLAYAPGASKYEEKKKKSLSWATVLRRKRGFQDVSQKVLEEFSLMN